MDTRAGGTDIVDSERMVEKTRERSNIYGFLAAIYRAEPTAKLLRQIKDPSFLQALADVGITLDKDFLGLSEKQVVSDLALEYTRLFVGPGKHISPHESVHTPADGGSLWGKSTAAVKQFIESVGVEFRPEYHGIPDHISVGLEFMQKVTEAEAQAWQRKDRVQAVSCLQIEKEFVSEHVAQWVPRFCEKVIAEAELSFYREMAILTRNCIESDKEEIEKLAQEHRLH